MNKSIKCFIVEGLDRDYRFINRMVEVFFKGKYESITISLPAGENIYMLYEKLKKDNFETDLIELLREDDNNPTAQKALIGIERQSIDEIYLFFDYDIHQENLPNGQNPIEVLQQMLDFYDNETENGKLYLNYPMVEALYDYQDGYCEPFTTCKYPIEKIPEYKTVTGSGSPSSRHMLHHDDWRKVISVFGLRIQCLFEVDRITHSFYRDYVSTVSIFEKQISLLTQERSVFILSAFPEFLLDYFKKDFWASHINRHKYKFEHCPKNM